MTRSCCASSALRTASTDAARTCSVQTGWPASMRVSGIGTSRHCGSRRQASEKAVDTLNGRGANST
ncbi:hypothetical protein BH160DRAFT_7425, partial [Burkholderia sp. H160]